MSKLRTRPFKRTYEKVGAFHALLIAETLSSTGSSMTLVALPWLILATSADASKVGIVVAAEIAPTAVLGLVGGGVVSRFGPLPAMRVADALRTVTIGLIPLLFAFGIRSFALVVALTFLTGCLWVPYSAAQQVVVPLIVGEELSTLARASSALQTATRTSALLAPLAAGALIGVIGAQNVLVFDAISYCASFALVTYVQSIIDHVDKRSWEDPSCPRKIDPLLGIRYVAHDLVLRLWGLASVVREFAWQGLVVAIPIIAFVRFHHDAKLAGLMFAFFGAGAVGGSIISYWALRRSPATVVSSAGKVAQCFAFWLIPFVMSAPSLILVFFAVGMANGFGNGAAGALYLVRTPEYARAETNSVVLALSLGGGALGGVAMGLSISVIGVSSALLSVAILQTVGVVLYLRGLQHFAQSSGQDRPDSPPTVLLHDN